MFTGIVTEIGQILDCQDQASVRSLTLERPAGSSVPALGASIACSGICLTVCEAGVDSKTQKPWFRVEASEETRKRTTLERWKTGDRLNLEPALKVGDELGGHLVFGHVDAVGSVHNVVSNPDNEGAVISFLAPDTLSGLLAVKGSITIDGVSLTVNTVENQAPVNTVENQAPVNEVEKPASAGSLFSVTLIPYTLQHTTLGQLAAGDPVNLEADMIARYVAARLNQD